ncbi:MAG: hypothetical protein ACK4VO_02445 [Pseudobdellovibrio sp.]
MDIFKNKMPDLNSTFDQAPREQHSQAVSPAQSTWIRELVSADEQLEKSVMIDMNLGLDTQRILVNESIQFLLKLKNEFAEASAQFNELKPSVLGRIKVYGIAKTHADFMLFRNGYKMIFSIKSAGVISMRFHYVGNMAIPQPNSKEQVTIVMDEELFEAKWGAFEEVLWTYKGQSFKTQYLVRHYLTLFIKDSSR